MPEANEARANGRGAVLDLPDFALQVIEALEADGHEAWVVGGCVRDALLGRACADVDVATSAPWREAGRSFERQGIRTHETGIAHGTITAVADGRAVEVTTYRTDGPYAEDARHPESVTFVRSVEEDLARRDFTMNAMAYHPARGLLDPFGGWADLEAGLVRAVGDPARRFSEDALRILRACRFAAQLGFRIEERTFSGMIASKGLLPRISAERVTHELDRLLTGPFAGEALLECVDVLSAVLPELVAMKEFEQHTRYHVHDVLEHTARVIDGAPASSLVRWAALLHDMGKPALFFMDANGVGHFYGHPLLSTQMARGVMARLALPSALRAQVLELVLCHDDDLLPTPRSVRRMLAGLGGDVELFRALCDLKRADAAGQAPHCRSRIAEIDEAEKVLDRILAAGDAFTLKRLAVDGRDAMELGVPEGPLVGEALGAALEAAVDGIVVNERDALRAFIAGWVAERVDEAHG